MTSPSASALVVALAAASAGCAADDGSPPAAVAWAAERYAIDLPAAPGQAVDLRYRPPSTCTQVYRVVVDDDYPEAFSRYMQLEAEKSESFLALGADALTAAPPRPRGEPASPRLAADAVWSGRLNFFGPKTQGHELQRELHVSGSLVGLGSPDAACFERTWDPIEDSLALGWPQLPGRLTAIGERWTGARVESRCNRSACVNEEGAGGPDQHHLSCVTQDWHETLDGIYELGEQRVAAITSAWSDGNPPDIGIWAERTSLIASDDGRLLVSEITIHHNRFKVVRNLRIEAVDECPGGLVAGGWTPPPEGEALATAITRARDGLEPRKQTRIRSVERRDG